MVILMKTEIQEIAISKIKPNQENPRTITDENFEKLVRSIKEFPDMLFKRPLIIDEDFVVLGGKAFKRPFHEVSMDSFGSTETGQSLLDEFKSSRAYLDNIHDNMNNVWSFNRTSAIEREHTGGHATPKPIELCKRVVKSSCPDGGLVLDSFLGSGSTMVAAHQLNRKCYGIELDPRYCQVIVDRMLAIDPDLTVKINGDEYQPK